MYSDEMYRMYSDEMRTKKYIKVWKKANLEVCKVCKGIYRCSINMKLDQSPHDTL